MLYISDEHSLHYPKLEYYSRSSNKVYVLDMTTHHGSSAVWNIYVDEGYKTLHSYCTGKRKSHYSQCWYLDVTNLYC